MKTMKTSELIEQLLILDPEGNKEIIGCDDFKYKITGVKEVSQIDIVKKKKTSYLQIELDMIL